ncbi:RDD family protein [Paenibacillus cellulosilyticus]|uniref:RDD family protein n=1 Tax=Paenibacillus cellulosilyticus TaxID=375489 RepID=A0A2V2YNY7_9BACL|nr:RDD family protein [Paenibacillus cellulosilyticus]PWV97349.1 RDD family protein [Paenibacillus cellulosilyticus]QKS47454.1 RDD family protein [Paenibacillus cellulosilyticus]
MYRSQRIAAFLIDHIIFSIFSGIIFLILIWDSFFSPTDNNMNKPFELFYLFIGLILILYFFKDIVQGRSIGKRLVGISIIDKANINKVPNRFKLFVRNITILIWPIEAIILVITGNRLGDYIVNSTVIKKSE